MKSTWSYIFLISKTSKILTSAKTRKNLFSSGLSLLKSRKIQKWISSLKMQSQNDRGEFLRTKGAPIAIGKARIRKVFYWKLRILLETLNSRTRFNIKRWKPSFFAAKTKRLFMAYYSLLRFVMNSSTVDKVVVLSCICFIELNSCNLQRKKCS